MGDVMREKGSLFNRIKDFFKIQRLKKKKKEQEKLQEKKKKEEQIRNYNRRKMILLSILGLFIGLFEPKKKQITTILKINQKVDHIHSDIKQDLNIEALKTLEKLISDLNIEVKKVKIRNPKESQKIEEKLVNISKKIKEKKELIKQKEKQAECEKSKVKLDKPKQNLLEEQKKNLKDNKAESLLKKRESKQKNNSKLSKKIINSAIIVGGLSAHVITSVTKELMDDLHFKNEKNVSDLELENQNQEDKIEGENTSKFESKARIEKKNLKMVDNNFVYSKSFNYDQKKFNEKQPNTENPSDIEKKQLQEEFEYDKKDVMTSLSLMQKEIDHQKIEMDQFKIKIRKMDFNARKRTILSKIGFLTRTIVNVTFSFFPMKIFKNKLVGGITSAIILNNRIRHLKRILHVQDEEIQLNNYTQILKEINNKKDILLKSKEININTLVELDNIEEELLMKYKNESEVNQELREILEDFDMIRSKILTYNHKIEQKIDKAKKIELNQRQKIKKLQ